MTKKKTNGRRKKAQKQVGPRLADGRFSLLPTEPVPRNRRLDNIPGMAKTSLPSKICSITNPFCKEARGAQYPDGYSGATIPFQVRNLTTINTLSNGGNVFFYTPASFYTWNDGGSVASNVYTLTANNAGTGSLPVGATTYRIVSAGVVIRNVAPALTAQGQIIVSRVPQFPAVSSTVNAGETFGRQVNVFNLTSGLEVPVVLRPLGMSARDFAVPTTLQAAQINPVWEVLKVEIIGGVTGAPAISIETFLNVEFTVAEANVNLLMFAPPKAPAEPTVLAVSSKISDVIADISDKGVEAFGKFVETTAGKLVAKAFPMFSLLG